MNNDLHTQVRNTKQSHITLQLGVAKAWELG